MNYDAQQYAFSHGLATTPQLRLQQQQQQHFKQQHHIFQQQHQQQQYSQAVPTSSVYHFQFGGAGNPVNPILQHKDVHSVGMSASMQRPGVVPHGFVQQPFIKQAVPLAFDGNSVHVVNGMIYSQPKGHVKNLPDLEGRLMRQSDGAVTIQQGLVGVDTMSASNFTEQNVDMLQQQTSGVRVTGQGIFYDKTNCSAWLQPSQMSSPGSSHQATNCQSTLPSFSHVWSQFSHHKHTDHLPQHKQIHDYHSPQNLQHPFQQQQHMQAQRQHHLHEHQQFTADPSFQTLPGIQVIKMQQQQQKPQQTPIAVQTLPRLPQQFNCFSVSQPSLFSPTSVCKQVTRTEGGMQFGGRDAAVLTQVVHSRSCTQPLTTYSEHHPSTAVTYTVSGPPKFTVTLDSLTHSETFSLNHFPDRSDAETLSSHVRAKPGKIPSSSASATEDNCPLQSRPEWQVLQQPGRLPKPFLHTSSMGSSFERCSSESSSFSSPPYTFTPPSSVDLMFSPDHTPFSKTASESSLSSSSSSSGRTSTLSSSSSSFISSSSSSPPAPTPLWPGSQTTDVLVPTVTTASSVASSTCTTSTATVVFSSSTAALTTTSVTSTTPNPAERTRTDGLLSGTARVGQADTHILGSSPTSRLSSLVGSVSTARHIPVPYSWHRRRENGTVVYVSPSGTVLHSLEQICAYLLSDNTCKCGLECPIQVEECFSFDPDVESQSWTARSGSDSLANLCNHRRHVLALATFHSSQAAAADVVVEKVKKREHNKSVSGDGLIVAPLKRLKTSITNAVNRHAVSLGHAPSKPETFGQHLAPHTPSPSPIESCSNLYQGEPKPSFFDCHRSRFQMDDEEMLAASVQQHFGDQAEFKPVPHQQFYDGQQMRQVDHGHHTFMPADGSLMFQQGPRKERVSNISGHYSLGTELQRNKFQAQSTASQLSHRHKQPANLDLFYPQGHVYPHLPGASQQRPPGYHPAMWKDDSQSAPTVASPRPHPANNFQHSNCDRPRPGAFKHSTPEQPCLGYQSSLVHQSVVDLRKAKSKRPKSKKEKQKHINGIVDRSSPCSKALTKVSKVTAVPTTSASFFGNPIVFVEQQTAMINNSIASCHIACASPPPHCETTKPASYRPAKDVSSNRTSILHSEPGRSLALRDLEKNGSVDKDEEDDQKTATDLDSNKSFSDTTENNDSAYLSQTGSDIDKSDTADGLDSYSEAKCKPVTSIYSCHSSATYESRKSVEFTHVCNVSPEVKIFPADCVLSKRKHTNKLQPHLNSVSAVGQLPRSPQESQDHTSVVTQKKREDDTPKDISNHDVEMCKKNLPNCLNGDLSHLLASNNWNIPALQQVLAQYSGSGDPGQLNSALQHALTQTLATRSDFPASNLLSAAARAQLHDKQKVHIPSGMAHQLHSPGLPQTNINNLSASSGDSSVSDLKAASVSPAVSGSAATSQPQHIQSSYPHVATNGASLVGNFMQLQQLPSGNFAVNMLLPGNRHGQAYASDSAHSGTVSSGQEFKSGQGMLMTQGVQASVSQTGDARCQVKLPVASVMSSSLGSNIAQCSPDGNTMLLNNLAPRMIVNAALPPVSVSIVTNVTKSLTQVVPAISINQTMFGTQQMLNTQQAGAQILGTGAAPAGTQIINTSPQGAQLVTAAAQTRQFINPSAANTQLVGSSAQTSQIVSALSLQGLSNQLVIASPIQQMSPSVSQLSPAVAAQILASQGHQHLQQMSPSFLHRQLHKQGNQNILASVSLPATSSSLDSMAGSAVISANIHKNTELLETVDVAKKVSQATDAMAPLSNSSLYAATSQPVFVIPQPSTNPLMQVLAPTQTPNTSAPDMTLQQNNLSQVFGQSPSIGQSQLQSLLATGFNPLAVQQMVNTVSLNGVQQQQQQLQVLQLQQLMLQQLQNHGQNIQGISLPLNQASSPSQATAIVNAIVPQQGLQLNPVMDMNSLHSCLSPLAQGYQKQQLQRIPSALAVQQVTSLSPAVGLQSTVGLVQNGSVQNLMQGSTKHLQTGHSLQQQQSVFPDVVPQTSQIPISDASVAVSHESLKSATALAQQLPTGCPKTAAANSCLVKPSQPTKPKAKSKSKKSENKKAIDPGTTERNEEDVAATVQQILAQAVQQQRELSLAAKNQPPPPPKSKSKKNQSRSRANQVAKEHDLGRLMSISDDVPVLRTDHVTMKELSHPPGLLESHHFTKSSHSDLQQSFSSAHPSPLVLPAAPAQGLLHVSSAGLADQSMGDASPVGCSPKKSSISLKDHLSFIISKDKDGHGKRLAGASVQPQAKARAGEANLSFTLQPTSVVMGFPTQPTPTVHTDMFHSKI